MAFILKNSLLTYNDQNQPYSIEIEKDNPYNHLNGRSDEKGYAITFSGARAYLDLPQVKTFSLSFEMMYNKNHCKGYPEVFAILFGYDRNKRVGYQLEIEYLHENGTAIRLTRTWCKDKETIAEQKYPLYQECDVKYNVDFKVEDKKVICDFAGCKFEYEMDNVKGKVALLREHVFDVMYITNLVFESEEITQKQLGEYTVTIPQYNGMHYPYRLNLKLFDLGENIIKIDYEFAGGLFEQDSRNELFGDTWAMMYEEFDSLYFKLNDTQRFYLKNGLIRIFEENFTPKEKSMYAVKESVCDLHKAILDTWREPPKGSVTLKAIGEVKTITFGYKNLRCFRSEFCASPMQYVFNTKGEVLYAGEALDEDYAIMVSSPLNKGLVDLIPQTVYEREKLIEHLEDNHYFLTSDDKIEFGIDIRSKFDYQDITVKAYLQDAFFNNIESVEAKVAKEPFKFKCFESKSFSVELKGQKLGVYHLYFEVYYCGQKVAEHCSAFEVIDPNSETSPQEASKLYNAHVGDSGKKPCPNLWLKQPDFNIEHYLNILLVNPSFANLYRVWEVYPIFKREITCWMNGRCVDSEDLMKKVPLTYDITKHADYLYYTAPGSNNKICHRYDFYVYRIFRVQMIEMLENFLRENENVRKEIGLSNVLESFTLEDYKKFMNKYSGVFINYCLPQINNRFIEEWKEVKNVNPKAKRFSYGPWSAYVSTYIGAYSAKWQGFDIKNLEEIWGGGYFQFEDYPHDCNYSTTRGAWGLSTIKLYAPTLRVFPELYDTWLEGCPDEALPGAHPPLGFFYCEPYACMTQIFEYIYNSAYNNPEKKGAGYWRDFGLMLYSLYVIDVKAKFDEFMPAWGIAMQNLPKKPLKGGLFLYEIPLEDDRFNPDCSYDYFSGGDYGYIGRALHNLSETGMSYVYKTMREAGVPVNAITNYAGLNEYTKDDIDILVIPSLKGVDSAVVDKIRNLYNQGTPIIAVSEVAGLEDIFGVKLNRRRVQLSNIHTDDKIEYISPIDTEVYYDNVDGEVLLKGENEEPIIIRKGNALLINAPVGEVGIEALKYAAFLGAYNISTLMENIVTDYIREVSTNGFKADKRCGVTTFENEKGEEILLLIDYSKDLEGVDYKTGRLVEVQLPKGYKDVVGLYGAEKVGKRIENGDVVKITVQIKRQQSILLKLEKK